MKVRITQTKAPWPEGSRVGDVVAFSVGAVPAWAAGKCEPVGEDDETVVSQLITPPTELGSAADPLDALRAEAQAFIDRLRAEHGAQVAELQGKVDALLASSAELQAALATATEAKAIAEARAAELQGKVDAAAAPTATKKK